MKTRGFLFSLTFNGLINFSAFPQSMALKHYLLIVNIVSVA